MSNSHGMEHSLEVALAHAHGALDCPTPERLEIARSHFNDLLPRLVRVRQHDLTLEDARRVVLLIEQLQAVMVAIDRLPAQVAGRKFDPQDLPTDEKRAKAAIAR